ncbi:MAG TPA: hypothetical protein VMI53_05475 [Opitutaceae bacterium]|nr:hypothetical protein [Opitutaceae bacterium]
MKNSSDAAGQEQEWEDLYVRLAEILAPVGKSDAFGEADYWLVDDNWGCRQQKLYVSNLRMLAPAIVKSLQASLAQFPNWEIVVAVTVEGVGESWPKMGLIIRPHEIIDGLQRQYFPKEFQVFKYEGSKPGPVLNET